MPPPPPELPTIAAAAAAAAAGRPVLPEVGIGWNITWQQQQQWQQAAGSKQ
jgi:hypothetical protein